MAKEIKYGIEAQFEKEMKAMRIPTPNWPLPGE